ncbi:MAG: metallophosphoesterase [Proteobacteria bacterium]|nr:metallophosphoesterase [Pseudomonadota bacterium]
MLLLLLACPAPETDPVICDDEDGPAAQLTIAPYLQWMQDGTVAVMWETDVGQGGSVTYGSTANGAKEHKICAERVPALPGGDPDDAETQVWMATLDIESITGGVRVRARTGAAHFDAFQFQTPEAGDFRFAALSDSQKDSSNPDRFAKLVRSMQDNTADDPVDFVLMPGDLVDNGWMIAEWQDDFFGPAAGLLDQAPLYPAIGNHEGGSPLYFRYFHMPNGLEEHAYTFDRENVRVVTLDSNGWLEDEQLTWLDEQLDATCTDPEIDFVFAQLHHPWLSELWTPGNTEFTGDVVARLESLSTDCQKPSIHFFGHTHGYSRGQSRDHDHVMVNVASAGGALDRWGEQPQEDYAEFSVSQDHYGYVLVDVTTGDAPSFTMTRYSFGTPEGELPGVVTDSLTVWRDNTAPATPTPTGCLTASPFEDTDGHAHQATHWQLGESCDALDVDIWRQSENQYMGRDTQADDDLTDEEVPDGTGCFRVRYRDEGLVWSDWSDPEAC